ncbi:MAG: TlpA disulfide reductase family protein [Ghiorsea sp.]|nr:TlpA disulfide reductase family protein [Ghiorsea sp.]
MRYIWIVLSVMLFAPLSAQSIEYQWQNAEGEVVTLASLQNKPVILHFWASWCPPCRTEMPAMDQWVKAHPNVHVVMISLDNDQKDAQSFYAAKGIQAPLNMGSMRHTSRLGVRGLPTTIIIDQQGEVSQRHMGNLHWADEAASQKVLGWLKFTD